MKQEHWIYTYTWHTSPVFHTSIFLSFNNDNCAVTDYLPHLSQSNICSIQLLLVIELTPVYSVSVTCEIWCFHSSFIEFYVWPLLSFSYSVNSYYIYFHLSISLTNKQDPLCTEEICFFKTSYVPVFCIIIISSRIKSYVTILNNF